MTLDRMNTQANLMDQLDYDYQAGTNRLVKVTDAGTASVLGDFEGIHDYDYDAIGQMTEDVTATAGDYMPNDIYIKVTLVLVRK